MKDDLIVFKTYMFPSEAYPVMAFLKDSGIDCFLSGEGNITVHPLFSSDNGNIKILVRKEDYEQACKLLEENQ